MLLCIKFSPFHPINRPSVCQSVYTYLDVALHSALAFLIVSVFAKAQLELVLLYLILPPG